MRGIELFTIENFHAVKKKKKKEKKLIHNMRHTASDYAE